MTKPVVQFRLRGDLYDRIKRLASDNGRSLSNQIEYMLDGYRENSIKDDLILAVREEISKIKFASGPAINGNGLSKDEVASVIQRSWRELAQQIGPIFPDACPNR